MGFVVYCHVSVVKGESGKILMAGTWCIYGFMRGNKNWSSFSFFFLFSFYGKQDGGEAKILFSAWECFMQRPEAFSFLFFPFMMLLYWLVYQHYHLGNVGKWSPW